MFEVHFFALFGITSYSDVMASKYDQGWTFYMFKAVFASYLTLSIIVLINLLIARYVNSTESQRSDVSSHRMVSSSFARAATRQCACIACRFDIFYDKRPPRWRRVQGGGPRG